MSNLIASEIIEVTNALLSPEGPAYDGQGNLAVSNCASDFVTQFNSEGQSKILWRASADEKEFSFKKTNGMTYFEDGSLFICDFHRNAVIRIAPDGKQEMYAEACDGVPLRGPNDLAFDPHGHLYFTDPPGSNAEQLIGCVYRVERDTKKVIRVADGMAFPNGLAFSADGRRLYVAESYLYRVLSFDVSEDGSLSNRAVFCQLPDGFIPDGMNFDVAGNLWVAVVGPGKVAVIAPDGTLIETIQLPGTDATNLEFGDLDLKSLYVTLADTGQLFKIRVNHAGLPLFSAPTNATQDKVSQEGNNS
jgi:gluconolactonase